MGGAQVEKICARMLQAMSLGLVLCVSARALAQQGGGTAITRGGATVPDTGPAFTTGPRNEAGSSTRPATASNTTPEGAVDTPIDTLVEQPVVEIRVVGNENTSTEKVLSGLGTKIGRPFDQALLEKDVRKLLTKNLFLDVRPVREQVAGGVRITFMVVERPMIQFVKYLGNSKIKDRKLAKTTELKRGTALDPYAIEEGKRKVEELYKGKGYNDVQVTILEGTKKGDRGVIYLINEGNVQKVRKVQFEGNTIASDGRLKTQVASKPPLLWLFKGQLDRKKVDEDVEKLTAYYRSLGFFRARIAPEKVLDDNDHWATLTFVVDEGPRYKIRDVKFAGNTKFTTDDLVKGVKLKAGEFFDQGKLNKDLLTLQDAYGTKGYVFANVQRDLRFLEEPGELDVVFSFEEGSQYAVGMIDVHIESDNPHTRFNTVLNRLMFRPGDVMNTALIRNAERRIKASGIFVTDPQKGQPPKITFNPPDGENTQSDSGVARRRKGKRDNVRSQSPDPEPEDAPEDPDDGHLRPGEWVSVTLYPVADQPSAAAPGNPTARPVNPTAPATYQSARPVTPNLTAPAARPGMPNARPAPQNSPPAPPNARPAAAPPGGVTPAAAEPLIIRGQSPDDDDASAPPVSNFDDRVRAVASNNPPASADTSNYSTLPVPQWKPQRPVAKLPTAQQTAPTTGEDTPGWPLIIRGQNGGRFMQPYSAAPAVQPYGSGAAPSATPAYGAPAYGATAPPAGGALGQPAGSIPVYGQPPAGGAAGGVVNQPDDNDPNQPIIPPVAPPNLTGDPPADPGIVPPTLPMLPVDVTAAETQTGRLMFGVGINSNAGLIGSVVVDEMNFDWRRPPTSWNDWKNGTAFRGAGQHFRVELAPGTLVSRYLISFQEPYLFDTNVSFNTSAQFFQRFYTSWTEQRAGGRVGLGYQFRPDITGLVALRAEAVDIKNPQLLIPDLQQVLGVTGLYSVQFNLINDIRDNTFFPTEGRYINVGFEQAFGSFAFPKATLDLRKYFTLRQRADGSGKQILALYGYAGASGRNTPIYERFFMGGMGTLRGFYFRGASPTVDGIEVGGDFTTYGTVEYTVPITADDMFRMAAFCDAGIDARTANISSQDVRVAPGFGVRISVPAMGPAPISIDLAFPVMKTSNDRSQVINFSMGVAR